MVKMFSSVRGPMRITVFLRACRRAVFHDVGLTRTDEIAALRQRVAELEQQLLDRKQGLQDRDDELGATHAANRDLVTTLNSRMH